MLKCEKATMKKVIFSERKIKAINCGKKSCPRMKRKRHLNNYNCCRGANECRQHNFVVYRNDNKLIKTSLNSFVVIS